MSVTRKPTMHDVARRAGVSTGTVSNVLNDPHVVSADKRERVLAAIAHLGYLRNSLAQSLKSESSRVIGLCVPHAASAYFTSLIDALEDIAYTRGFEMVQILSRHDPDMEYRRVETLLAHRIAGLIMVPSQSPHRTFDLLDRARIPAIMVDRFWPDERFDYVTMNNSEAMTATVAGLVAHGHRHILYTARYPDLVTTQQRITAFEAAGRAAPEPTRTTVLVSGEDEIAFGHRLIAALRAPDAPTAVIASNSVITLWVLRAFKAAGITYPDDVSLVAFDEPVWADVMTPPLSIIRHPSIAIAEATWELLMERLGDSRKPPAEAKPRRHVQLPATLELRGSVGAPRIQAQS
ncbi:LacI family transcriptional regulator [Chelatococcus asaccharovorans]|nr:LacI family transcriptional regulator [Chelatococcus asaccharovorans]CAH1694067.1 LacI family transcriptional regulator [Chelatococcus asaccharovorans]